jgi:hypothetical protein
MLPVFGLSFIVSIVLCVHAVRTNQNMYWLWIILMIPWLGALVYLVAVFLPDVMGGTTARRMGAATRAALDPERDYRAAKSAHDDSPTVGNAMRMAAAAASLGRYDQAEQLYADAARGIHADDPTLLLGRANALLELNRFDDALGVLEQLGHNVDQGRTPQAALALGRACEGVGRITEADTAYAWAAERMPGLEAMARYAAFMAHHGRRAEAEAMVADIDKRIARIKGPLRGEARGWRDLAAQALN